MRWSVTFFFALALASGLLLIPATADGASWALFDMPTWLRILRVTLWGSVLMVVVWGAMVRLLGGGGPDGVVYRAEYAWRREPKSPMRPVGPTVPVTTGVVVTEYRPQLKEYGAFARATARTVLPFGGLVLAYVIVQLTLADAWSAAKIALAAGIVLPTVIGGGWVLMIFARSRVLIHPDGVTVQGAFRKVVVSNSANCVVATGRARTALTTLGALFVDRATGRRAAVWDTVFEFASSEHVVTQVVPKITRRKQPDRELARYVSWGDKHPYFPVVAILAVLFFGLLAGADPSELVGTGAS